MVGLVPNRLRSPVACVLGFILTAVQGCGGGDGGGDVGPPPTPAAIAVLSGNAQSGEAGSALAQPIVVRVTSSSGAPVEGAAVTFATGTASGSVAATEAATDAEGRASAAWTVGTEPGPNLDTVYASVSGVTAQATFTASITPAQAASISLVSGDAQAGTPGQQLVVPLIVVVRDRYGNPRSQSSVSWTVMAGGGSISPATTVTGNDGHTSALWTLGSAGINTVHAVSADLSGSPVSFSATAAAPGTRLAIVGGNNQTGAPGQPVALPLVVSLETPSGAPVAGIGVTWATSTGGGMVSQSTTPTDALGQASVIWTLGAVLGQQSVTAGVAGATGSPLTFNATAATPSGTVTLTSITPNPMVEGEPATLVGTGFSATRGDNKVKIDGADAVVTAGSATSLTVQIPAFDCQPARRSVVQVRVGEESSNAVGQDLHPAAFTSVAVGQQLLLQNPQQFCLQFAAAASPEDYLIGVQSTSEVVTSLTPATLHAVTAASTAAARPLPEPTSRATGAATHRLGSRRAALLASHRTAEQALRTSERRLLNGAPTMLSRSGRSAAQAFSIPPDVAVGDLVTVRMTDPRTNDLCSNFVEITTGVKVIGARGIWLADVTNPAGGYSDTDFQTMSDQLDNTIYTVDVDYFGAPTDVDGNSRLVVVVTDEINKLAGEDGGGLLGFVFGGDLFSRTVCGSSNEGEIFYGIAPDPEGEHAFGVVATDQALANQPLLIAHEFTHTIQFGRRLLAGSPPAARWFIEGQATLAEEVVGHAMEGRAPGNNYGAEIAFNSDGDQTDWYSQLFTDLAFYFGVESSDSKVAGAPEQCSWLDRPPANPSPCSNSGRHVYLSWSLLRWLTDQYGPGFAGGPQGLQRALINNPAVGYGNISAVLGVPMRTLLAGWAATLYTDDRVAGLDSKLMMSSWNLFNIFDETLVQSARLVPRSRGFASFTDNFSVRAGSSAYFRVSGNSRPATALRVRNSSGGTLPAIMQMFVVRLR